MDSLHHVFLALHDEDLVFQVFADSSAVENECREATAVGLSDTESKALCRGHRDEEVPGSIETAYILFVGIESHVRKGTVLGKSPEVLPNELKVDIGAGLCDT